MEIANYKSPASNSEVSILKTALTQTPKVRNADEMDIVRAVNNAIEAGILYLGLNTNVADRDAIKILVISDIKRHFLELTVGEISAAIDNGVHGNYGEVRGLAPKDVYAWLSAYSVSDLRKQQLAELAKESEPKPEPTAEQKRLIRWNNMLKAWEAYKKEGGYVDYANSVYRTLVDNGRLKYPREKVVEFMDMAIREVTKEYNPLKHVGNFVKANEFKAIIQEVQLKGRSNARVKASARNIMLNHFFSELVEMEMEITDLFN